MKNYIGYTVTVLMAAFTMVGCGKNSDSGTVAAVAYPNGYGYGACAGCVGNTQSLTTGTSQNPQLGEALQLSIYGTAGSTYAQYAGSSYSQVAAQGILHIGQLAQECGLPYGDYQITTSGSPAVMQGGYIQGLTMTGTGPTQVMIQFQRIYFTSPTQFQASGVMYGPGAMTQCSFNYY